MRSVATLTRAQRTTNPEPAPRQEPRKENASEFDDHYRAAIHFAVGLCRLAGRPDLARELKTSAIYRG